MFDLLQQPDERPTTFAEPGEGTVFGDAVKAAMLAPPRGALTALKFPFDVRANPGPFREQISAGFGKQDLVDNLLADQRATEEAYDRRIAAIRMATGVELENPMRGGYQLSERERRRLNRETEGGIADPAAYRQQQFDMRLGELRGKHPDQAEALTFGDLRQEARDISKAAEERGNKPYPEGMNPVAGFVADMLGALGASTRDPLFVGSLFLGPTSAIGKTVTARVASSGLFQGLYNMGLSAVEQPAVQAWRAEVGVKSGLVPALEHVGMAFLFGAIPGAGLRGIHEALARDAAAVRPAIERVLAGNPEPGDAAAAVKFADELRRRLGLLPDEGAEPPIAQGMARFYHGGTEYKGGPRWLTPDRDYAQGYASKSGDSGFVQFVDIPENHPLLKKSFDDEGTDQKAPYVHFEAPEEIAKGLRRVEGAPSRADIDALDAALRRAADLSPEAAAVRLGDEMLEADRAILPRAAKDVSPELHDDLTAAALKRADNPTAPSPEAVAAVKAIEAWHGSPYDFEAFDMSKLLTGEGSNAIVAGHYLAENRAVGVDYREKLSVGDLTKPNDVASTYLRTHSDRAAAIEGLRRNAAAFEEGHVVRPEVLLKAADLLESGAVPETPGVLYRVRIRADKEHFLDWDKTLSEQSEHVQRAFRENEVLRNALGDYNPQTETADSLYRNLKFGRSGSEFKGVGSPEAASQALRKAGIPGVKYLDQGSRDFDGGVKARQIDELKEQLSRATTEVDKDYLRAQIRIVEEQIETRNFVLFDDKLIEITHKNDVPVRRAPDPELQERIAAAKPQTLEEAQVAASEALEDMGTRAMVERTQKRLDEDRLPPPAEQTRKPVEGAPFDLPEGTVPNKKDSSIFETPIFDHARNKVGTVSYTIDTRGGVDMLQIVGVGIDEGSRGRGLGVETYQHLADIALGHRRQLWSDRSVSPEAARLYEALEQRGYTVVKVEDPGPLEGAFKVTAAPERGASKDEPPPSGPSLESMMLAIGRLAKEQGGISTSYISDLQKALGVPLADLQNFILSEAKKGHISLGHSSLALSAIPADRMAAAIKIEGETPFLTVTPTNAGRAAASADRPAARPPVKPPPATSKDPLDFVMVERPDGSFKPLSARQAASEGAREQRLADIARACK